MSPQQLVEQLWAIIDAAGPERIVHGGFVGSAEYEALFEDTGKARLNWDAARRDAWRGLEAAGAGDFHSAELCLRSAKTHAAAATEVERNTFAVERDAFAAAKARQVAGLDQGRQTGNQALQEDATDRMEPVRRVYRAGMTAEQVRQALTVAKRKDPNVEVPKLRTVQRYLKKIRQPPK